MVMHTSISQKTTFARRGCAASTTLLYSICTGKKKPDRPGLGGGSGSTLFLTPSLKVRAMFSIGLPMRCYAVCFLMLIETIGFSTELS